MANDHVIELGRSFFIIRIVQYVLAVLVLAFSAYDVTFYAANGSAFAVFTAIFTLIVLIYYSVASRRHSIFNWPALLALECLAVLFWLCTWALLAALYAFLLAFAADETCYDYGYCYKRKRDTSATDDSYGALLIADLAVSVVEFLIFCYTLFAVGKAVHRHRKSGMPMLAGGTTTAPATGPDEEKNGSIPMTATGKTAQQTQYPAQPTQTQYPPQPEQTQYAEQNQYPQQPNQYAPQQNQYQYPPQQTNTTYAQSPYDSQHTASAEPHGPNPNGYEVGD